MTRDNFIVWERLRFKYDNKNRYENVLPMNTIARELLLNAVKINEYISPQIMIAINAIKSSLNLDHEINVFIKSNPNINAYSYFNANDEINILLTSALVNIMTIDELKFVIAHECAHILFEHHKSFSEGLSEETKRFLSNACELSCDRLAHALVSNPLSSYSALLKIESGLSQDKLNLNVREYLLEYKRKNDYDSFLSTTQSLHPFINTRIKSLLLFETSDLYYDIMGFNYSAPSDINRIESKIVDEIIKNGFVRFDLIEKDHQDKMIFWTRFINTTEDPQMIDAFIAQYGVDKYEMGVRTFKSEGLEGIHNRIKEKEEALKKAVYLI